MLTVNSTNVGLAWFHQGRLLAAVEVPEITGSLELASVCMLFSARRLTGKSCCRLRRQTPHLGPCSSPPRGLTVHSFFKPSLLQLPWLLKWRELLYFSLKALVRISVNIHIVLRTAPACGQNYKSDLSRHTPLDPLQLEDWALVSLSPPAVPDHPRWVWVPPLGSVASCGNCVYLLFLLLHSRFQKIRGYA